MVHIVVNENMQSFVSISVILERFYGLIMFTLNVRVYKCMHLADTFIQSDLQCIQAIHVLSVGVFPGN